MDITDKDIEAFNRDGYLIHPDVFTAEEVDILRTEVADIIENQIGRPEISMEQSGKTPRLIYGADTYSAPFAALARHPRWINPAKAILGSDVYIHQLRINPKSAFQGGSFWWHQDFATWHFEDGMPTSNALMIAVFLDDIHYINGPLMVIPGSHKYGEIQQRVPNQDSTGYTIMDIDPDVVSDLAEKGGIVPLIGSAGSIMFMHCNLMHASAGNVTPLARTIVYVNANSVNNTPVKKSRASYHCNYDFSPLQPLPDDCLLASKSM